ncbi:MAG TPA: HNH endonuclease signature motif containing protein [Vicinamibacterales bacterium]
MRTEPERFWAKVDRREPEECWLRSGAAHGQMGYAAFKPTGWRVPMGAHRYSWLLHFGEIPAGSYVLHICHNPRCVNPGHLYLGTHAENMRDMVVSGRSAAISESNRRRKGEKRV